MATAQATQRTPTDALRDAWQVLLPAAHADERLATEATAVRRFAVLPTRGSPRWYIPIDSRRYAMGAAALYRPHRRSARVAASVIRSAAHLGAMRWYPSRLSVDVPSVPALESLVEDLTGCSDVRLAVYAGRGGRKRATVLVAGISERGELQAFARIAVSPDGDEEIKHEAESLAVVNALRAPAPELLWTGQVDGRRALMQRAIQGTHSGDHWSLRHDVLLAKLVHGNVRPLAESALVASVKAGIQSDPRLVPFSAAFHASISALRGASARPVINHRDFAPWNIIANADGGLTAIDWESAERDGLPHLDKFYFEIATGVLLGGWSADRLANYLEAWPKHERTGLITHQATALLTVLVLERLLRWRADGLDEEHVFVRGCLQALKHVAELEAIAA